MEGTNDRAISLSLVSLFLFSQLPFNTLLCWHQSHSRELWALCSQRSSWAWLTAKQLFRQESMEQRRNPRRGFRNSQYVNENHRRSKDRKAGEGSSGSHCTAKPQAFQKSPGNGFSYETMSAKTSLLRKLSLSFSTLTSSPQSSPSSNKANIGSRVKDRRRGEWPGRFTDGCYFLEWGSLPKASTCRGQHLFLVFLITCSCLSPSQRDTLLLRIQTLSLHESLFITRLSTGTTALLS